MAVNPMQKKARSSFMLGMIIAILICALLVAAYYFMVMAPQNKKEDERGGVVKAYALKQNVVSGQVITKNMLEEIEVYSTMIPANAIKDTSEFYLADEDGNLIYTKTVKVNDKEEVRMYIKREGNTKYETVTSKTEDQNNVLVRKEDKTEKLYITNEETEEKEYIKTTSLPVVAKVNLNKNTILTQGMVTPGNEEVTDDLRYVEYNMFTLPTTTSVGSVIDIRLTLPNGLDLVVVSKKEIKQLLGNTVGLNLTEDEILMLESAIVEAYIMEASKIYVTEYVEPGNQNALSNTYVPTEEVQKLITADGNNNIQELAKQKLRSRFDSSTRENIQNDKLKYYDEQLQNLETGIKEQIENAKAAREAYLAGLDSY